MPVGATVDEMLGRCRRSAVHLEMRDGYMLDEPNYVAWRHGHRFDLNDRKSWWHPWFELVSRSVRRGVVIRRARIVSEPVSEYIRWEHYLTPANLAAGEEVRWLPRRIATDLALPGNDFWLFDDEVLLVDHFSGDGDWVAVEQIAEPAVVRLCATSFEAVWQRALPHADYPMT